MLIYIIPILIIFKHPTTKRKPRTTINFLWKAHLLQLSFFYEKRISAAYFVVYIALSCNCWDNNFKINLQRLKNIAKITHWWKNNKMLWLIFQHLEYIWLTYWSKWVKLDFTHAKLEVNFSTYSIEHVSCIKAKGLCRLWEFCFEN